MRAPDLEDAADMWRLARDSSTLDVNSPYAYLLLCWQFRDTCLVAESDATLIGFVTAHWVPRAPGQLFVWQLAVDERYRRRRVGRSLLDALVEQCVPRYVEATIAPSNLASRTLFRSWAEQRSATFHEAPCLPAELFPPDHEAEHLVRIGPLPMPAPATVSPLPAERNV